METNRAQIADHYARDGLLERIRAGLEQLGIAPDQVTITDLSPVDEFHTGGLSATTALLDQVELTSTSRVLDIGSGLGGTARQVAERHGCAVEGVDLTPLFVETASHLSAWVGSGHLTRFHQGNATSLPLANDAFDLALLLHVGMNVADKAALFREVARVLAPRGTFAVFDVTRGQTASDLTFPLPWASHGAQSFVEPADSYLHAARAVGFELLSIRDRSQFARDYFDKALAQPAPLPLGIHLLMGADARTKLSNFAHMLGDDRVRATEMIFRLL